MHRYPKHPKSAAARVIIARLMEQLDTHDARLLKVRAELATFYGNSKATAEVEGMQQGANFDVRDVSYEVSAHLAPRSFTAGFSADTLTIPNEHWDYRALGTYSKKELVLPLTGQSLVDGTQTWLHNLGKVVFATKHDDRVRWTIWVADFKAGRLRAFLPSKPLPDLTQMEEPLLVWSADGKRLRCGDETFVVD